MINETTVTIGIIIIFFLVVRLLVAITSYFNKKAALYVVQTKKETNPKGVLQRVELSSSFLGMIDMMIDIELTQLFSMNLIFSTPYNVLNIDKDIERIGRTIQASIKPDMFVDSDVAFDKDFIFKYITTQVSTKMMDMSKQVNHQVHMDNAGRQP